MKLIDYFYHYFIIIITIITCHNCQRLLHQDIQTISMNQTLTRICKILQLLHEYYSCHQVMVLVEYLKIFYFYKYIFIFYLINKILNLLNLIYYYFDYYFKTFNKKKKKLLIFTQHFFQRLVLKPQRNLLLNIQLGLIRQILDQPNQIVFS